MTAESPDGSFSDCVLRPASFQFIHMSESKLDGARHRQFPQKSGFVLSKDIPPTAADLGWLQLRAARIWRRTIRSARSTQRSDRGKKKKKDRGYHRDAATVTSCLHGVIPQISVDVRRSRDSTQQQCHGIGRG